MQTGSSQSHHLVFFLAVARGGRRSSCEMMTSQSGPPSLGRLKVVAQRGMVNRQTRKSITAIARNTRRCCAKHENVQAQRPSSHNYAALKFSFFKSATNKRKVDLKGAPFKISSFPFPLSRLFQGLNAPTGLGRCIMLTSCFFPASPPCFGECPPVLFAIGTLVGDRGFFCLDNPPAPVLRHWMDMDWRLVIELR